MGQRKSVQQFLNLAFTIFSKFLRVLNPDKLTSVNNFLNFLHFLRDFKQTGLIRNSSGRRGTECSPRTSLVYLNIIPA